MQTTINSNRLPLKDAVLTERESHLLCQIGFLMHREGHLMRQHARVRQTANTDVLNSNRTKEKLDRIREHIRKRLHEMSEYPTLPRLRLIQELCMTYLPAAA